MDYSVFLFSFFPLILFSFPPILILFSLSAFPRFCLSNSIFFYSIFCQVAELKSELKLRSLPVSGTKNDLIERLRTYQDLNGGSDTSSSPTAGGTTGPGAEGADKSSKTAAATSNSNTSQQQKQFHCHQTSSLCAQSGD